MCGICGIATRSHDIPPEPVIRQMAGRLAHRGPDDDGFLFQPGIGLGFRRLSIIDVEGGHQPIHNEDKSVWAILNGEIYNYIELRQELLKRGHHFFTQSDTETLVHAYEEYGLDFLSKLRGMFALALWDASRERLVLARDRIGKKPLYYAERNEQLTFASEIKSLLCWPQLGAEIDPDALRAYLTLLYIPSPLTILTDVYKLPPGFLLMADSSGVSLQDYGRYVLPGQPLDITLDEAAERLDALLLEATRIRLRSDVPLGAFLSGGIDSSMVVAYMQQAGKGQRAKTYSMGFERASFDERRYARMVARHLDTDHHEQLVTPADQNLLLDLVWYLDEPFADSSAIPTYLVSKAAREHVTVALSGDGGDELFAGYDRYAALERVERISHRAPGWFLKAGHRLTQAVYNLLAPACSPHIERLRILALAFELSALTPAARIPVMLRYFGDADLPSILSRDLGHRDASRSFEGWMLEQIEQAYAAQPSALNAALFVDTIYGLPDDMLTKVDRMSMAVGLEVRAPLLDQEVVDFALSLPAEFKYGQGTKKKLLKHLASRYLPPEIIHRRKWGFGVPFGPWLTTTFRPVVEECLSTESLSRRGIFEPAPIVALRDSVLAHPTGAWAGASEHQRWHRMWMVLMFELWARQVLDGRHSCAS
ncbi:MAG: asparagine synthase (glutamine-hydrolyzing) [Anaerolineae bacterium]|nr:asparagine synthase (glutamine-hydrolyzing) [Anaerolineae bacterium]